MCHLKDKIEIYGEIKFHTINEIIQNKRFHLHAKFAAKSFGGFEKYFRGKNFHER